LSAAIHTTAGISHNHRLRERFKQIMNKLYPFVLCSATPDVSKWQLGSADPSEMHAAGLGKAELRPGKKSAPQVNRQRGETRRKV
jgi:hypothetical protein